MKQNLRHLRVFVNVARESSVTRAAEMCNLSQPAVTQAIAKLERLAGQPLFHHGVQGLFVNEAGEMLGRRVERALSFLDHAMASCSPRLSLTATTAQLSALVAVREMENFTLAARHLGIAQPTVHRAVTQLESEVGKPLFERSPSGMRPTRICRVLADSAQLAFAELDQAAMELAERCGREVGRIVVGAMPLARSYILPGAITRFRRSRPKLPIRIDEGSYDDLLSGLRRGEIDFLIGALRDPLPIADVEQYRLFDDDLVLVVGPDHPLAARDGITLADLAAFPWIVARPGAPTRSLFDNLFKDQPGGPPEQLVETGSLIFMRQLVRQSDHVGCISRIQAAADISYGLVTPLKFTLPDSSRAIGVTTRTNWFPTPAQRAFLDEVGQSAPVR